ncbi:MAG: hypothetical protein KGL95_07255, partial [Patescibacteria group bacterium]|nr:hypothetical protein [Patescibacteria group bacterium]
NGPYISEMEAKQMADAFLAQYEQRHMNIPRENLAGIVKGLIYEVPCQSNNIVVKALSTNDTGSQHALIAIVLPWNFDLFEKTFKDPYHLFLRRLSVDHKDSQHSRQEFITFYSSAVIFTWSEAFADLVLSDHLVHPIYTENIFNRNSNQQSVGCVGYTVAIYPFYSIENNKDLANQFAAQLQRELSFRATEEFGERLNHVMSEAKILVDQLVPGSTLLLSPSDSQSNLMIVTLNSSANTPCLSFIEQLYKLVYSHGLRIDSANSTLVTEKQTKNFADVIQAK